MSSESTTPSLVERPMYATVGIDSVYLQYLGLNKFDVMRFAKKYNLIYSEMKKLNHTRKWKVALAGKHSIIVIYHFSSKTLTFQIGGLMNYSIDRSPQHQFAQDLVSYFAQSKVKISRIDIAFDVKKNWDEFLMDRSVRSKQTMGFCESSVYFNGKNKTKLVVYDKAVQMGIFSTVLTRFELRIEQQLSSWDAQEIFDSRESLQKLSSKITEELNVHTSIYSVDMKVKYIFKYDSIEQVLLNFVGFLHGGQLPVFKDHNKVLQALVFKEKFLKWMHENKLTAKGVAKFLKKRGERGIKGRVLEEIGMDTRTFDKGEKFFKANPKFKFSVIC